MNTKGTWPAVLRATATLCVMAAVTHGPVAARAQGVNPRAAALKAFSDRTREYMALHTKLDGALPRVGEHPSTDAMARHRQQLAAAIRAARGRAREGDLFTPDVAGQFRGIIRADLQARDFQDAIAAVQEVSYRSVRVNMPWPPDAPRPTIPARLLTSLYPLPEGLEYRLLDRHLVLLDVDAEIVVDLVRNVLPSAIKPKVKAP